MKPEKINLIFSVLFIIYASSFAFLIQDKEIFDFEEHGISSTCFCVCLVIAAFYNVMAYFYKNGFYYIIGALGFLLFFLFELANITALILVLTEYLDELYFRKRFFIFHLSNFLFPLSIFALCSTLYCYQKMYHQEMDGNYRTTTSSKPMLLKFCSNDFTTCIKIYNYAIFFTTLLVAAFIYKCSGMHYKFQLGHLIILLPLLTPVFNLMAIKFKVKWFCIPVIIAWALLSIFIMYGTYVSVKDEIKYGRFTFSLFIFCSTLFLMYAINVFVGFATTLFIITHLNSLQYGVTNSSNSTNNCKYELESISTNTTRNPRNQIEREESTKRTFPFVFQVNVKCRNCDNYV